VATFVEHDAPAPRPGGTATLPSRTWTPPAPTIIVPAAFPDAFEVLVFDGEGGARLVAAIELVSPANKDRDSHRRAFAIKCASYLCRGIALIVVDIVTSRRANLHGEIGQVLGQDIASALPPGATLYATAYRPIVRDGDARIEIWAEPLEVGRPLPTVPLALNAEIVLPVDLESTYTIACQRRRLA
jgi:hypothetical protein